MKLYMRGGLLGVPDHWPPQYNACTDPCDMLEGPCACGAWHQASESWIQKLLAAHGDEIVIVPKNTEPEAQEVSQFDQIVTSIVNSASVQAHSYTGKFLDTAAKERLRTSIEAYISLIETNYERKLADARNDAAREKARADNMVGRNQLLRDRPDLPLTRLRAYTELMQQIHCIADWCWQGLPATPQEVSKRLYALCNGETDERTPEPIGTAGG